MQQISSEDVLSNKMLKWVVDAVDPASSVLSIRRLQGGTSSLVHSISLQTNQTIVNVVLRQFTNEEWLQEEPDIPLHEAECLRLATSIDVPTPRLIAYDVSGEQSGIPAILMTQLAGSVILKPTNMNIWLDRLAATLSQIHKIETGDFGWSYFTYQNLDKFEIPAWSKHPDLWNRVIKLVQGTRPAFQSRFIHRDYHPANVLWNNDAVSGVVDWVNGCCGPSGIDVGHCRVDLAMLYGTAEADAFLAAYNNYSGFSFQYDVYWDFISLIDILFGPPTVYQGWTDLGFTGLTDELMIERLDNYFISLIKRASIDQP